MKKILFLFLILFSSNLYAYKETYNPHSGRLDKVGVDEATDISDGICADGQILKKTGGVWACGSDNSVAGGGSVVVSEDGAFVVSADVVNFTTGIKATTTGTKAHVSFDTVSVNQNRTWGDASDASIAWSYDLSGTDAKIKYGSGISFDPDGDNTYEATIDTTGKISADGGFTAGAGADPSLTFDVVTAGDTDFWAGVQDDAGGDDDDSFQIGTGTTVGSNTRLTLDKDGNVTSYNQSDIRFSDSDGTNYGAIQAPATIGANYTLTLPDTDGDADQYLKTNGSGVLSWATVSGGTITGTDTHVMFFDGANTPAGDAGFTYNKTTDSATLVGDLTLNGHDLVLGTTSAGVTLTDDGDGQLTIAAKGDGSQENLTLNLDDTSNQGVFGTSTGLNQLTLGADGSGISLGIANDVWLIFGISGVNAQMAWESTNTVDDFQIGVRVGANGTGGYMSLMERADMGAANRSPAAFATHPTFRVYSADAASDSNGYIQLYHDETDGYIDVGSGVVSILDPTSVTGALSATTTVTAGTNLVAGSTSGDGTLVIHDDDAGGDATVTIQAVDALGTGYTLTLPPNDGSAGQVLHTDGSGVLTWDTDDSGAGGGDPVLIDGVGVSDGSGVDLIGGTNGIDIAFNAGVSPDTATFNLDLSEISAGDLANASVVEDDLAASLTFDDGDLLDFGTNISSATEGIMLPAHATSCASATAEGQVCWEEDADNLWIGDGTAAKQMNGGTDTNAQKVYVWPASATLPLEAADSIPPIGKDAGTNIDMLHVAFDSGSDECRSVSFQAPPDITSGTVTFKVYWYSAAATTGAAAWDFRHNGGVTTGTDPDQALTTEFIESDTTAGTAGQLNIASGTETVANLGWSADELVYGEFCRDGDGTGGTDDLSGDALAIQFTIEIPRA